MHTHARRRPEVCNKMRTRSTQQCVLQVYYMARTHTYTGEVMARRRDYKSQPVLAPTHPSTSLPYQLPSNVMCILLS